MKATSKSAALGLTNPDEAFEYLKATFRSSLKLWDYFVNWDKVLRNTKLLEVHLNIWNYLLGKDDFKNEMMGLLKQHPEIVKAIPSLIVRDGAGSATFEVIEDIENLKASNRRFDFSKPPLDDQSRLLVFEFIENTGLIRLFKKDGVKNLVDYVIGVEAGLDSNARKNRSGTSMETVVSRYLETYVKDSTLEYISQATPSEIKKKWGFEVPTDKASRIFDFAISDGKKLALMEVNFYGGGGSKLKATADEYKGLNKTLFGTGIDFIWVTDGQGWFTTLSKLREAFDEIDYVWNLSWLVEGFLDDVF